MWRLPKKRNHIPGRGVGNPPNSRPKRGCGRYDFPMRGPCSDTLWDQWRLGGDHGCTINFSFLLNFLVIHEFHSFFFSNIVMIFSSQVSGQQVLLNMENGHFQGVVEGEQVEIGITSSSLERVWDLCVSIDNPVLLTLCFFIFGPILCVIFLVYFLCWMLNVCFDAFFYDRCFGPYGWSFLSLVSMYVDDTTAGVIIFSSRRHLKLILFYVLRKMFRVV